MFRYHFGGEIVARSIDATLLLEPALGSSISLSMKRQKMSTKALWCKAKVMLLPTLFASVTQSNFLTVPDLQRLDQGLNGVKVLKTWDPQTLFAQSAFGFAGYKNQRSRNHPAQASFSSHR